MRAMIRAAGLCLLALAFIVTAGARAAPAARTFVFKDHGRQVGSLDLDALTRKYPAREVTIRDINEKKNVTYAVISFNALMHDVYGARFDRAQELLFTCIDGYQPSLPRKLFTDYEPLLAFARKDDDEFALTNKLQAGKRVPLGPFYLVWDTNKTPAILERAPDFWPYQIAAVDLVEFEALFPNITPPKNATKTALAGFTRFRELCSSCHSINGQGGKVGPELNYPTSVTEMLYPAMLRRWLAEPEKMRFRTAMPGVPRGTRGRDAAIHEIIEYLEAMKGKKIAPKPSGG